MADQLADERRCYLIIVGNNYMIPGIRRQFPGRPASGLRLHPGRKKELDENKRQKNQQKNNAGQKHQDGKSPADVAGERDVAETQSRHDHYGPVKTGDPGMLLPFQGHKVMKNNTISGNQCDAKQHIFYQ